MSAHRIRVIIVSVGFSALVTIAYQYAPLGIAGPPLKTFLVALFVISIGEGIFEYLTFRHLLKWYGSKQVPMYAKVIMYYIATLGLAGLTWAAIAILLRL